MRCPRTRGGRQTDGALGKISNRESLRWQLHPPFCPPCARRRATPHPAPDRQSAPALWSGWVTIYGEEIAGLRVGPLVGLKPPNPNCPRAAEDSPPPRVITACNNAAMQQSRVFRPLRFPSPTFPAFRSLPLPLLQFQVQNHQDPTAATSFVPPRQGSGGSGVRTHGQRRGNCREANVAVWKTVTAGTSCSDGATPTSLLASPPDSVGQGKIRSVLLEPSGHQRPAVVPPSEPEMFPAVPHLELIRELQQSLQTRLLREFLHVLAGPAEGSRHLLPLRGDTPFLRAATVEPRRAPLSSTTVSAQLFQSLHMTEGPAGTCQAHLCTPRVKCHTSSPPRCLLWCVLLTGQVSNRILTHLRPLDQCQRNSVSIHHERTGHKPLRDPAVTSGRSVSGFPRRSAPPRPAPMAAPSALFMPP